MAEEQGDKNTEISDSEKMLGALADMIKDACSKMDEGSRRLDARMDALEEKDRKDSAKKDEEEKSEKEEPKADAEDEKKIEEKGEPKEVAADRKDEDEKEEKSEKREDRKDAKRKDEDEDEGSMADHAPISRAEAAALRAQIAGMNARAPSIIADADRERFATIQESADPAFQAFGDRAPGPLEGETPTQYKRRLGAKLQSHSPKWKDARLSAVSDDAMLDTILHDVYADSITAARRGVDVPAGHLRKIERQSGGHTIIEWEGQPESWMNDMAGHTLRATGTWHRPH